MTDELEPLGGTYDWDRAFAQNPGEPEYEVSYEQRTRVHNRPWMPVGRPDYPVAGGVGDSVARTSAFLGALVLSAFGAFVVIEKRVRRTLRKVAAAQRTS